MSVETQLLFDPSIVSQLSQKQQEPGWMLQSRLEALQNAAQLPLPNVQKTNINRWNFTNFKPLLEEAPVENLNQIPEEIREFIFTDQGANVLVQKNSSIIYRQAAGQLTRDGVIFTDLATAAREHEELFKKYFMTAGVKKDEHKLTALHAALFSGGLFLYVPRNVELELPLQSLFWVSGAEAGILPHVLIVAEESSRVDFIANYVSLHQDQVALNNSVIEVFVGPNAHVRVATVNNLGDSAVDVTYRRSIVDRDGRLEWIVADLSDGRIISDNTNHLQGIGGNVNIKTVAVGAGEMRSNITSSVLHEQPHTLSDIQARSVMKDKASSILNSITKIEKGASKSDGQQSGKVLMLHPEARGDANPILLIDENDVVAGHAASVGRIDPLQLYYLMSRGITRAQAEKLIIFGFLDAVVSEIPSESLQQSIHRLIERKFQS
ncbi:Fe-S cluster assembly protein SufD [Paenactinomyces guangxiensis]|uniref:Fe-S cluster assembly protein SufD n=1 Tax=Paenactinomyces guangxiensis TaxID=1490290 RepID=A0A7W1WPB5_9BACL|nr:Fe-S cluster assembly protein SufD [Paenactinomyces guangxiensis]MBA4493599.1 Fe-S cluster assembly protein SufD [Paenactinomyces guangxiensis]MBH8590886.1 Fe-S cluster assembly protein SufD [Paenactinomyces guangxiensis]